MSRTLKVATIQMNVAPAPTTERLARAEQLVVAAAQTGARLVALPEVFNTGYTYTDDNYTRAEPIDGLTATWMRDLATRLNIHLAGSLLLLDHPEIYNALLLVAPDGQLWRYDKNYPCAWEHRYFRGARHVTIAETELGRIGMLICWDCAHRQLWRRYAGAVDLLLICSSPPDFTTPIYILPDGTQLTIDILGPLSARLKGTGHLAFDEMIDQQTAWLGVPTVCAGATGQFSSYMPDGRANLISLLPAAPWLARHLRQANRLRIECAMLPSSKIVDAHGTVIARLHQEQGNDYTTAVIELTDRPPLATQAQPPTLLPRTSYMFSDILIPLLSTPSYRRKIRSIWAEAKLSDRHSPMLRLLIIGLLCGALIGIALCRRKTKAR